MANIDDLFIKNHFLSIRVTRRGRKNTHAIDTINQNPRTERSFKIYSTKYFCGGFSTSTPQTPKRQRINYMVMVSVCVSVVACARAHIGSP